MTTRLIFTTVTEAEALVRYAALCQENSLNLTTPTPDSGGFRFYVEAGAVFDAEDYAAAYGLDRNDIDALDVLRGSDAAARLSGGQWLEVTHYEASSHD